MRCSLYLFFLAAIVMTLCCSMPAAAQNTAPPNFNSYIFVEPVSPYDAQTPLEYARLVKDAFQDGSNVHYQYLRYLYTQLQPYKPFNTRATQIFIDQCNLENMPSMQLYDYAEESGLTTCFDLIRTHLGNIDMVMAAWDASKKNPAIGTPKMYKRIYNGLLQSMFKYGKGLTLDHAYYVISPIEERIILKKLGHTVLKTEEYVEGSVAYNKHYVLHKKTREPFIIFINTSAYVLQDDLF